MTELRQIDAIRMRGSRVDGRWAIALLALTVACGDASPPGFPPFIGSGGTSGTGGMGGISSGGTSGTGGMSGTGGTNNTGGNGGTGGSGGTAGSGGSLGPCTTSALCHTCPTQNQNLCETDSDCFTGYVCVPSGCETHQGVAISQCQPSRGGSCSSVAECPNDTDYACAKVGAGSERCLRVTSGCTGPTESYDCPLGFSCEASTCVDRRVPCDNFIDCPKNHVCKLGPNSNFCVRVYQTCHLDQDCAGLGTFCENVDNDSPATKECVGQLGADPCVNSACASSSAPVCEAGGSGTTATCGDYGLCLNNDDCDTGFE
ncbi:MAG: hypothetical protein WCF10_15215, partial [Polyangiales bacterium]